MRNSYRVVVAVLALILLTGFKIFGDKRTKEKERQDILEMREEVLAMLYEDAPSAKQKIENSAG